MEEKQKEKGKEDQTLLAVVDPEFSGELSHNGVLAFQNFKQFGKSSHPDDLVQPADTRKSRHCVEVLSPAC